VGNNRTGHWRLSPWRIRRRAATVGVRKQLGRNAPRRNTEGRDADRRQRSLSDYAPALPTATHASSGCECFTL